MRDTFCQLLPSKRYSCKLIGTHRCSYILGFLTFRRSDVYVFPVLLVPVVICNNALFFFLFVFYTFKKTACDESAERSQGDEPTRREKNKSLPNWISSSTKVCIFSYLLCGESPDLLALNAKPYLPCLRLLINRNIFLSGLNFGSRSIENSGNVIYSTTEMRVLFFFPRLVVTMKEGEPQMKVQMPSCLTKGIVFSQGLACTQALLYFSFRSSGKHRRARERPPYTGGQ